MLKNWKKNKLFIIIFLILYYTSFAQRNEIKIKYSIKNEKNFLYNEKIIDRDTLKGYSPAGKIFFKNKQNLKLYFLRDQVFLNNKLLYCFKNVQYYESLLVISSNNKEYIYIYPHYYGSVGPYVWYELGVLIEIKSTPVIKENIDYFEDYELDRLLKFKKYKIRNLKKKNCDDGSIN